MTPIPPLTLQMKIERFVILLITLILAYFLSKNWLTFIIISVFVHIVIKTIYRNYKDGLKTKLKKTNTSPSEDIRSRYRHEFEILMQAYVDMEFKYAISCKNVNEYIQFRNRLDGLYDRFNESFFTYKYSEQKVSNEEDWFFYSMKNANKSRYGMEATFSKMHDLMIEEDSMEKFKLDGPKVLSFYKEEALWYIDLPEFLDAGLGTKANLMMVAGADILLDKLSKNGDKITLQISNISFVGWTTWLEKEKQGKDDNYLQQIGHAPVDNGAYYKTNLIEEVKETRSVWLCPVTEYVFHGYYPENIYIKVIDKP